MERERFEPSIVDGSLWVLIRLLCGMQGGIKTESQQGGYRSGSTTFFIAVGELDFVVCL